MPRYTIADVTRATQRSFEQLSHAATRADRHHRREMRLIGSKNRFLKIPFPYLKQIQRDLLSGLLSHVEVPPCVFGRKGRGPKENAEVHCGASWAQIVDLRDAFPSTTHHQVKAALERAGFDGSAAGLVTRLCTAGGSLPQGAPTSNVVLDIVMASVDEYFFEKAASLGLRYSRFVDDIAVSGSVPVDSFVDELQAALRTKGFQLNARKSHKWGQGAFPIVTGVVAGNELRPTGRFLKELSQDIRRFPTGENIVSLAQLRCRLAWVEQLNSDLAHGLREQLIRAERRNDRNSQASRAAYEASKRRHARGARAGGELASADIASARSTVAPRADSLITKATGA